MVKYTPKMAIWYRDNQNNMKVHYLDMVDEKKIDHILENSKFIKLGDVLVPIFKIQEVRTNIVLGDVDEYILSLSKEKRDYLLMKKKNSRKISEKVSRA